MKSRRAFIASGAIVAGSGCLSGLRRDPNFLIEANTVERGSGVIYPSISVDDELIGPEDTASVEISVRNQSLHPIWFGTGPIHSTWFGSPYSENGQLVLTRPDNVIHARSSEGSTSEGDLCWREENSTIPAGGNVEEYRLLPIIPEKKRFSLATSRNSKCISPGHYRFNTTYYVDSEEIRWQFEIVVKNTDSESKLL